MVNRFHAPIPQRLVMLPVVGQQLPERADAARNRRKILDAAAHIVAVEGASGLSLDDVARAARVGVGTVYRRFGDRAGLVFALLDDGERQFQSAFMMGPPPLGPGVPPTQRIRAFLRALVDRVDAQQELILLSEADSPMSRYQRGSYEIRHIHMVTLISQVRPHANAHYLADALLAPITAGLISHQLRERDFTLDEIKDGLDDLLDWGGWRGRLGIGWGDARNRGI